MLGAVVIVHDAKTGGPENVQGAVAALRARCERVLVVGGTEDVARSCDADYQSLPREAGELVALIAALHEAEGDHVAILAADLRHPSSELVRYMQHVRGSFDVVAPERRDGSLQPLAALYHPSLLRRAEGLLTAGERDLAPLLQLASVRRVTADEVAKFGEPEDLLERVG